MRSVTCRLACRTHRRRCTAAELGAEPSPSPAAALMLMSGLVGTSMLIFSSLDSEWSLKETLRVLTGLGGTTRKGMPAKVAIESAASRSSVEKLRRLWEGDMLGVGWITLISI